MCDRLGYGESRTRAFAGPQPIGNRPLRRSRGRIVSRDEFGLTFGQRRKMLLHRLRDVFVVLPAPAEQQRLVCRVLQECVAEGEYTLDGPALRQNDLGSGEPLQFALYDIAGFAGHRRQQNRTEFAANNGGDLSQLARIRAEPI